MNTVLVLVMLMLVLFALKEGMIWVALGVGLIMVLVSTGDTDKTRPKFLYPEPQLSPISGPKEQELKVKYKPAWDGNNWWEEMADHWGSTIGRTIGLIR